MSANHQLIRSHRDITAWQRAMDLAVELYELSRSFPPSERFGLTIQLNRAATSVPANIAEGYGRGSTHDYARFLAIARGSLREADTYVVLAERLGFVTPDRTRRAHLLAKQTGQLINALRTSVLESELRGEQIEQTEVT